MNEFHTILAGALAIIGDPDTSNLTIRQLTVTLIMLILTLEERNENVVDMIKVHRDHLVKIGELYDSESEQSKSEKT